MTVMTHVNDEPGREMCIHKYERRKYHSINNMQHGCVPHERIKLFA